MEFDRRSKRTPAQDAGERGAQAPGRRTLTEDLAPSSAHVGPSNQQQTASQDVAQAPGETSSGQRPTLQRLFRRRDIAANSADAAREDDPAVGDERSPEEELDGLGGATRERHNTRIAQEGDQVTTTHQSTRGPHATPGGGRAAQLQPGRVANDAALRAALQAAGFPGHQPRHARPVGSHYRWSSVQ